jgi:hypothetical protein
MFKFHITPPTPAPLLPLLPSVQAQNNPNQPLTAKNANQMPADANQKLKT